ncbi:MAG TPA: acyltransferase family protein [Virgibacillus sp.]|nr:acyltransferase family protein [Virgibacillus sp.]
MDRNPYFDNAKVVLIFLVVFGHMIQPFIGDSHGMNTLYMWMYTFSMPAFIFLAGFFAKGSGTKEYVLNLAKKLLLPYVIFQLLYTGYYFYIGKTDWLASIFYPHWSLWFLFSLFCWHILLYWFKKMPALLGIAISIQIGLFIGYIGDIGHTFSLSRTFVFFPFFLTGYWVTKDHMMFIKRRIVKAIALLTMVIVAIAIYYVPEINSGWLLASKSYVDLGMPEYGGFARLLVYITSTMMAISVLAWVPAKKLRITKLGSRTLYVYLLHGFFIQFFREADLFEVTGVFDLIGLGAVSAAIVVILSSKPILGIWQPLVEGKASIIREAIER